MSTVNSTANASNTGSYSSANQIVGMFSGLDTDSLVENMVISSPTQAKLNSMEQKLQTQEWYTEALSGVEDNINEFLSTYCTADGEKSMLKASSYYSYSVTSSSDSTAVNLTGTSSALTGDYSVKVTQLAVQANVSSSGISAGSDGYISSSNTATLGSLKFSNALQFGSDGKISFSINNVDFSFSKDTTLQNMINTVNNSDAGVTMKYSRITDGFTITADSGGADSSVTIDNKTGNAFGTNSAFQIAEGKISNGQNSSAVINGATITKDSNDYTIDGITFSLNAVTGEDTLNFLVKSDYSATADAISGFVDGFNALLTKLNGLVSAKDYSSDYPPLTEVQKKEMTDEQIETWNEKAKNGVLHNNADLKSLITNLKNTFYTALGGTGKNATSIGIATASYFDDNSGLFVLDKEALKSALEKQPDTIVTMFTNGSTFSDSAQQGLMYRLKSTMNTYKDTLDTSLETSELKQDDYDDEISELKNKLDDLADKYYNKFSVMETALAQLNSQASFISQLFA